MTPLKPCSPQGFSVLILEDDPDIVDTLVEAIKTVNGEAFSVGTLAGAKALVSERTFDVYLLDYVLPDGKGSDCYFHLREQGQSAPCIMLTGSPEIPVAVELTRKGLFDYLTKPFSLHRLLDCVQRAAAYAVASQTSLHKFGLVDTSAGMKAVRRQVHQAAANPCANVLITGETGVGKDLVASLIHKLTFQKMETPPEFVSLNCSTLPADMFEAELFGTVKGAYTGAHQNRDGLAAAATNGTLFLDEIAEVPLPLQAKLLQFLETRQYRRLGNNETLHFNGRIIAATNKPLQTEVQAGRFRADLWYRLDVLNIHVPPLRERKNEIAPLVQFLLAGLCQKYERLLPIPKAEDLVALEAHDFPGNVRELRNLVERSLIQTDPEASWLELDFDGLRRPGSPSGDNLNLIVDQQAPQAVTGSPPAPGRELSPIEAQEYFLIRKTLAEKRGVIRRAAAQLGLSHQALLRRLNKWPELRTA